MEARRDRGVDWAILPALALAAVVGVACGHALAGWPAVLALAVGGALLARRGGASVLGVVWAVGVVGGSVAGGLALERERAALERGVERVEEGMWLVEVVEGGRPAARPWEVVVRVHGERVEEGGEWRVEGRRLRLRMMDVELGGAPLRGDRWWVRGRVVRPRSALHGWAFDGVSFGVRRGLDGLLMATAEPVQLPPSLGWRRGLDRWRVRMERAVVERVEGEAGGVLLALVTGSRGHLAPEVRERFGALGAAHVLAVSGMHLGLLTATVLWVLTGLLRRGVRGPGRGRRERAPAPPTSPRGGLLPREVAALCCVPGILAYVLLTGAPPSAVRAGWMAGLVLVGLSLRRRVRAVVALSAAALAMLCVEPLLFRDAGVQLSFSATAALVGMAAASRRGAAARVETPRRTGWRRVAHAVGMSVWVSAVATAATAPPLLHHLGGVPVASPLANLLVVPPLALVALPTGVAGAALVAAGVEAGGLLLWVAGLAVRVALWVAEVLEPWVGVEAVPGRPAWWGVAAWVALTAALACAGWWRARRVWLVGGLALAVLAQAGPRGAGEDALAVHGIPVGHGDAFLVRLPGGARMLVDAGGRAGDGRGPGWHAVRPYLRGQGVERVDIMVSTHGHVDHAGGLIELLGELRPREVWLGTWDRPVDLRLREEAEALGIAVRWLHREASAVRVGSARVEVLPVAPGLGVNDTSLVLRVCGGGGCALLTGDAERLREADLAGRSPAWASLTAAVLKVGHHGSGTSTTSPLLDRVAPALALMPVEAGSSHGHPSAAVTARLARSRVRTLRLDQGYAVCAVLEGGRLEARRLVGADRCAVR